MPEQQQHKDQQVENTTIESLVSDPIKSGVYTSMPDQNSEQSQEQYAVDAFFDSMHTKQRSHSLKESREDMLNEMQNADYDIFSQPQLRSQSFNQKRKTEHAGFNRKIDGSTYKQDPNKVIQREYVDGVPLLMDLNEILNLDVISIAMEELNQLKRKQKRQKVMPADDDNDPDIYVEQRIMFDNPKVTQEESKDDGQSDLDSWYYVDTEKQVVKWLRNRDDLSRMDEEEKNGNEGLALDDSDDDGVDDSRYVSDDTANKRAFQCMMTGEYVDSEIDQLLEKFGVSTNMVGLMPIKDFDLVDTSHKIGLVELKQQIDEIKSTFSNWGTNQLTDKKRKLFLSTLCDQADQLGVSLTIEHLLPGLLDIVTDTASENEQYQKYMVWLFQGLGHLISFLSQSKITAGYEGIRDHLTPIYNEFFLSGMIDDEVRQELHALSIEQLAMITKILIHEDRADKILPIVLELLKDDEEKRLIGLELLDVLAIDFGPDICQNYLMYEIVSLQDDPRYKVRKETVKRIVNIAKVVSYEMFLGVLLPVFKKLCTDQIWGVRRQAVEILPELCKLAPNDVKNGALLEIFKKFTKDQSKWVKQAATQYLGPFIVCYQNLEPSPVLIQFYREMVEENIKMSQSGSLGAQATEDVLYHCAFNFPAVLLTLGKQSWPQLKEIHSKLATDPRTKVRKTLAYSLFELARILGPELTESELLPILFTFLEDIQEVKAGVLKTLPEIIKELNMDQRQKYAAKFTDAWNLIDSNWRRREQKAKQIGQIAGLLTPELFEQYYEEKFFLLCGDGVSQVRITAALSCYPILKLFSQDEERLKVFVAKLVQFKTSESYTMRQTFILMCQSMFSGGAAGEGLFLSHLLDHFVDMQSDKIVNVRLQLSESLAFLYHNNERLERERKSGTLEIIRKQSCNLLQGPVKKVYTKSKLCMHPKVIKMVSRLRVDSNRDVAHYLRHINLPEIREADHSAQDMLLDCEKKSEGKLSEYEKRELQRKMDILEMVEQDGSNGKSETANKLLRQLTNEDPVQDDEQVESPTLEEQVEQLLDKVYQDVLQEQTGPEDRISDEILKQLVETFLEEIYDEVK